MSLDLCTIVEIFARFVRSVKMSEVPKSCLNHHHLATVINYMIGTRVTNETYTTAELGSFQYNISGQD